MPLVGNGVNNLLNRKNVSPFFLTIAKTDNKKMQMVLILKKKY